MSFRQYPSRQTHAAGDYFPNADLDRQSSTTSSTASSGYSQASDRSQHSFTSTSSTAPNNSIGHRRGRSDGLAKRASIFENGDMAGLRETPGTKKSPEPRLPEPPRQSLRQLPQAPAGPSPPTTPPHRRHDRGKSFDLGKLCLQDDRPTPLSPTRAVRPNSMLLTRSDSIMGSHTHTSPTHSHSHSTHNGAAHIARPDLQKLSRSTTSQLRTLSRLAESESADDFTIKSPTQEVTGLRGRRKLQRYEHDGSQGSGSKTYEWQGRNWMDKQRQFLQAYEYLCHIGEAKEWIEDVIHKTLPPIVELEEALRDGVTLAEVVEALNPDRRYRIFHHHKLQYRHSDNIAIFFRYLDDVDLPDLFRFELIDLYEKKNIPKVIYCIHALSWLLFRKGIVDFRIGNLVGQLEFEHHELEAMQKGIDKLGINMPTFGNMGADFGVPEPEPEPEPEETEEERIDRELGEHEGTIADLQAQIRGALLRLQLGDKMHQFWDEEDVLIDLQSRIRGDFTRQIMEYRLRMRRFAVQLQSSSRGFLARKRLADTDKMWDEAEPDILELQSIFRAQKARRAIQHQKACLQKCAPEIRDIQAMVRGSMARKAIASQQRETKQTSGDVEKLQAAVRGMLARGSIKHDRAALQEQERMITKMQAFARASLERSRVEQQIMDLASFDSSWQALQSIARGRAARISTNGLKSALKMHASEIQRLQAIARANETRRKVNTTREELRQHEAQVIQLQGMVRAMLERARISRDREELGKHEAQITVLSSHARGFMYRQKHESFLKRLQAEVDSITAFQSMLRAVMERAHVADLEAELQEEEASIIEAQAAARAFMVRRRFEEKRRYFNENMQKVVKIQSFVRAKVQGEAYKSLTTGKNPPVGAVKNFVHLLNDSDFDFNEEIEFERMRKVVVQQVRQNEGLEQYIDQLDIKIALLVKNKITLDEVVRHQHNFGGHSMGLLANSSMSSANQFDLKALNKSSRKKLESYQQLFFNLQTQPQYLARLFRHVREQGTAEKECKRIELLVMGLFGYAQKRREEYYLLKLIARAIQEEVEGSRTIQDYQRGNFFWTKILSNYTRSPRDRKYLRDVLGPLIRDNIVEDPELDLESDPMQIYKSAINNEELRTGRPDHRPLDVPREVAIRDPETRRLFIDHLRDLREICDQFFMALEDQLHRMPYGLRFLAGETYRALSQHFKREEPTNLLQVVANWVWKFYLQPAVTMPEQVGVIEKSLSPLQKRNLGEVAKVIGQIVSGRPFGGENVYLQPLNNFVAESVERMMTITQSLIEIPDAERTFDIDEFNDLYAKNKPTLYIKMNDIFAIHNLVAAELPSMCPNRDDILYEIMHDLGSAKNNENEMNAAGTSDIHMFLTPKLHENDDPEAEVKALFMETKRCVLYIIRVQTGANLLEILVKPISEEDERKWQTVVRDDFADSGRTRGAYSDSNMMDVTRMSYYELKRTALENVMHLEQMGRISKQNFYQDVLNAIAVDIRSKSRRRVQRQRELDGVRQTLANLHEKAKYLEQQRKSYDDYIESAMKTLQNKKGKKKFLMPFTKQYNHQKELERSGRVPKFGSFKYSARVLHEKGVLVAWSGMSERDWEKVNLTISCDEVGVFSIEGSRGSIQMPGASALVPIEDLLQAQFEAHQFMNLFEGALKLNVNLLLHLLYKKFYRTQ